MVAASSSLEELLLATARGDEAAFARLYDATCPRVLGLARRLLRDPAQAEEVTQEVYLQVWQGSHAFDPARGSAVTWVLTLAHRRAVDRVRSAEASRRRDHAHGGHADTAPYDETAEAAEASLDAQHVRRALQGLSEVHRQALELAYFTGCTVQEVAGLTGVPLGTAKGRVRDALRHLRTALLPQLTLPGATGRILPAGGGTFAP